MLYPKFVKQVGVACKLGLIRMKKKFCQEICSRQEKKEVERLGFVSIKNVPES